MHDPMWIYKAKIGATGGISLVMLKLIEAKFFVADVASKDAIAAYLTYLCYIALGIMVACIFTDTDPRDDKMRKNAFTLGLLAPSLLLALVAQPIKRESDLEGSLKNIPKLGWFAEPAYAQETGPSKPTQEQIDRALKGMEDLRRELSSGTLKGEVRLLMKSEVEPSFKEAFLKALGREGQTGPYLNVLATSNDKEKALKAAAQINRILPPKSDIKAFVVKPEGIANLFVVLNVPASAAKTSETNSAAKSAALEALQKDNTPETVRAATLLLEGETVKARLLFE